MFILAPGHVTPWLSLNQAAHDARESVRAARQLQVDKRQASGAPESDSTDYVQIAQHLLKATTACEQGKDGDLQDELNNIGQHLGSRVTVPAEYEINDALDGVEVRSISMARSTYSDTAPNAWNAMAMGDNGPAKDFLGSCIEVQGIEVDGEISGADLWEEADILWTLMAVATQFQELSHTEKKRYGSQVAPT